MTSPDITAEREIEREFTAFIAGLVRALHRDHGAVSRTREVMARQQIDFSDTPRSDVVVNGFRSLI